MTDVSADTASRLTSDALRLATSLDSFTTLDLMERIGIAVQQGEQKLEALQRRRDLLLVTRMDGAIIGWLLETVNARLKFLERLASAMYRTRPMEGSQPYASTLCRNGLSATLRGSSRGVLEVQVRGDHAA